MKRSGAPSPADVAQLVAEQRGNIRGQLLRLVPASEVDDLLQEIFLKASRALPDFRGQASVGTWLHRIAERTALDHLRSRRHHEEQRTVPLDPGGGDEPCGPRCTGAAPEPATPAEAPGRVIATEMHGCIREFVGTLSPEHAEVITLKDIEGLSNSEIAARLGISVHAAKIRLHRARAEMRKAVNEGCEMYRTPENTLHCDRKPGPRAK